MTSDKIIKALHEIEEKLEEISIGWSGADDVEAFLIEFRSILMAHGILPKGYG